MHLQNHNCLKSSFDLENQDAVILTAELNTQQDQNQQIHYNENPQQTLNNHIQQILVDQPNILNHLIAPEQQFNNQDFLFQEIMPQELIQYSTESDQKSFTQRVILINLFQDLLMIVAIIYTSITNNISNFFCKNKQFLYLFYIVIAVTILLLMANLFRKFPKNKYFKAMAQILTKVLYMICVVGIINIFLSELVVLYALVLFYILFSYMIVFAIVDQEDIYISMQIKNSIEFQLILQLIIQLIIFILDPNYDITLFLESFLLILILVAIQAGYAMMFCNSLNQLINGKFKLRRDDHLAASTLVIINIFTPTCFQQA